MFRAFIPSRKLRAKVLVDIRVIEYVEHFLGLLRQQACPVVTQFEFLLLLFVEQENHIVCAESFVKVSHERVEDEGGGQREAECLERFGDEGPRGAARGDAMHHRLRLLHGHRRHSKIINYYY